jgi:hypothetical protein
MSGSRTVAEHVLDLLGDDSVVREGQQLAIVMDTVYAKIPARQLWQRGNHRETTMNPAACTFDVTAAIQAALMAQVLGGAVRDEDALTWTMERTYGDG